MSNGADDQERFPQALDFLCGRTRKTNRQERSVTKQLNEYNPLMVQDVARAMALWAHPPGVLYLVDVRSTNHSTGEALRPDSYRSLQEFGRGIYWFAIQEMESAERILFSALCAEKFQKLTRRWNRAESAYRFDIDVKSIPPSDAASFYITATRQQPELIRITLRHKRAGAFDA